jgi:hypothetical protein
MMMIASEGVLQESLHDAGERRGKQSVLLLSHPVTETTPRAEGDDNLRDISLLHVTNATKMKESAL